MIEPIRRANFDDTGRYRYMLEREYPIVTQMGEPTTCCFVMLNPSTATAEVDDPTIRRCCAYTLNWNFNHLVVINLFAYRATNPNDLVDAWKSGIDIIGSENAFYWKKAFMMSDVVILAWGADRKQLPMSLTAERFLARIRDFGTWPCYLAKTKGGNPRHPLYLPKHLTPTEWWP